MSRYILISEINHQTNPNIWLRCSSNLFKQQVLTRFYVSIIGRLLWCWWRQKCFLVKFVYCVWMLTLCIGIYQQNKQPSMSILYVKYMFLKDSISSRINSIFALSHFITDVDGQGYRKSRQLWLVLVRLIRRRTAFVYKL